PISCFTRGQGCRGLARNGRLITVTLRSSFFYDSATTGIYTRHFFADLTAADTRKYFETAKEYFAEKFGEENIRYAIVHLDESTPHMHMGIVPFDDEHKLSAKRVFNRTALRDIQDQLPTYLQQHGFNIQRGVQESERKSLTVPEYKAMRESIKQGQQKLAAVENETKQRQAKLKTYQAT
ncbi:MobV family relaxase, partial [Lactiplantibacillus pentosus]|uniref:MobV family relaxase n=1 Tax=Lactiplantibacillus pentosus TaxID=1589 RepID=UPI003C1E514C